MGRRHQSTDARQDAMAQQSYLRPMDARRDGERARLEARILETRDFLKRCQTGDGVEEALRFRLGVQIGTPKKDPMLAQVLGGYRQLVTLMR